MWRRIQFLLTLTLFLSCDTTRKISNRNIAYLYSPSLLFVNPEYKTFNFSQDSVRVFFRLNTRDLLHKIDDSLGVFRSDFVITHSVYGGYEYKNEPDTGQHFYSYIRESEDDAGEIVNHFDFACRDSFDYVLQLTLTDMNRNQAVVHYLTLDRTGNQSSSNFVLFDAEKNTPIIRNYSDTAMLVKLFYRGNGSGKLFMRYFINDFPLSPPPFTGEDLKPLSYISDKTVQFNIEEATEFLMNHPGIYHFQFDTLEKEGYSFFLFEKDFPLITSAESLIETIRYLTTREEYDKIRNSTDRKKAVDDYWLSMAGNRERARLLIKSYYSRVQWANLLFSSYQEGWKTDRGIIYIIFGPPSSVYRSEQTETWSYSQNTFYGNLNFQFDRIKNPFTANDYILRRNQYYEMPWYRAVDSWRDGRVVNDGN